MVLKSSALWMGFPHSGHSGGVSGKVSSSIVLSTSTKGTSATMPANRSACAIGNGAHQHAAGAAAMAEQSFSPMYISVRSAHGWRRRNRRTC